MSNINGGDTLTNLFSRCSGAAVGPVGSVCGLIAGEVPFLTAVRCEGALEQSTEPLTCSGCCAMQLSPSLSPQQLMHVYTASAVCACVCILGHCV